MSQKNNKQMHVVYETDDSDHAKAISSNAKNASVVFHNPNRKIPPILTSIRNGKKYAKYNPEYIQYLKEKMPGISEEEIFTYIKQKELERVSVKVR